MTGLPFVHDDGGRSAAGFRGSTGDCVTRSIAIATGTPYGEVYAALNGLAERERPRRGRRSSARLGVHRRTYERFLLGLGWVWTPTMQIGQGCRVHLRPGELPGGPLVVAVSRHLTAVVDGVVRDTADPCRDGTRCVYGYYAPSPAILPDVERWGGLEIPEELRDESAERIVAWAQREHGLSESDGVALARAVELERGNEDPATDDGLL